MKGVHLECDVRSDGVISTREDEESDRPRFSRSMKGEECCASRVREEK